MHACKLSEIVLKINIVLNIILTFLCPVNLLGQPFEKMVFELYLIKYIKYRDQMKIQASSKSQIQIRKYKYVFDSIPAHGPGLCPASFLPIYAQINF